MLNLRRRRSIRPWAACLFNSLLLAVLAAWGMASPAGAMAPQAATALNFIVRVEYSDGSAFSLDEVGSIVAAMEQPVNLTRSRQGWRCVSAPTFYFPDNDQLPPLADVGIHIVYSPADDDGLAVTTIVAARGNAIGKTGTSVISPAQLAGDRSGALADGAAASFGKTQAGASSVCPRRFKGKVNGAFLYGSPDGTRGSVTEQVRETYDGTFDYEAISTGGFYAQVPLQVTLNTYLLRPTNRGEPSLECHGSWSGQELLQLVGTYDDAAQSASVAEMNISGFGASFKEVCVPPARLNPQSVPLSTLIFLDGSPPLQLPIIDQAQVDVPRPVESSQPDASAFVEWSFTISLHAMADDDSPASEPDTV